MATLHGGQVLRQYCNKRSRKREAECVNKDEEEKDKSSMITTMPDSHHSSPCEPMKSKSPDKTISLTSQPQVIVRKFTLPALNSSHFNLSDRTKRNPNFAKPKQRWKQLCNLQHEMTTTLPVSKVKVLSSSPQLTREFRPGTLQSYPSGKLDIMSSTLHQLLTSNTTGLDSTPNAKAGKPKHLASPLQKSPSSSHKTPSSTFKSASSPPVKSSSSPVVKSVSSSVKSVSSPVKSTTVSSPAVKSVSSSIKSVSSPPVKSATVSSPSIKSVSPPPIESMPSSPVKSMSFLPIKSMSSPPVQSASSPPIQSVPSPPVITTTSPVFPVLKTTTVPPTQDPEVSKDDCVNVEQMLDTAEEVPYVAAVAEVSSSSGTIRLGPFDTSNNDIGIVGGKIVIFQQLQGNKLDAGNDKVGTLVVQNNQSAAVDAKSGKIIIGPFVGQKEPIKSVLKNTLIHGSSKMNSEASGKEINDSMQEDLKQLPKEQTGSIIHNSESSIKEQVELQGISKCNPNVPTKKQNVIWGNAKLNSERFRKEEINDAVATKCNSEMTSDNQKIIQRSVKLTEVEKKEQTVTQGNLKHELESTHKEQKTGTQGNLKNNSEVVNNGHVLTAHSLFSDPNLQKANRENFQEVINRLKAVISAQKGTEQIKNSESGDKLAGDVSMESLKKPLTSQQLQHQIALMKARQSIALQVEREVLRAKERSLVQEVNLPARKVFVAETSTQTSLFSLVEPGRMVEMLINTDKNVEQNKMVSSKVKPITGENSAVIQKPSGFALNSDTLPRILVATSGSKVGGHGVPVLLTNGRASKYSDATMDSKVTSVSDAPERKKARLDDMLTTQGDPGGAAALPPDMQTQSLVSDTMSVDSGIDIGSVDFQNTSQQKNLNVLSLNSVENSKADTLRNIRLFGNMNISMKRPSEVNNQRPKPVRYAKCCSADKDSSSVFDIIVQHNIAVQTSKFQAQHSNMIEGGKIMEIGNHENKLPPPPAPPMVYIPDHSILNSPKSLNTKEAAMKINSDLRLQAYKDWVSCNVADENGNIPLHKAVINENLTLVKRQCAVLCGRHAKLDVYNCDKETPLHLAVISGNAEITRILLSFGAQASMKDGNGNTALHLAVLHANIECVTALLNTNKTESLPLNDFNDEGYSPLHLSALNGKVEETRALITKGAEVNLKDAKSGRTPLFHAVEVNNGEMVRVLLEANANPNEQNFTGHTPLSAASEISFSDRNGMKEFSLSDGINFSSKLVSLNRSSDMNHVLDDGNMMLLEDIHNEIPDNNAASHCYKAINGSRNNNSSKNGNNPWFLND